MIDDPQRMDEKAHSFGWNYGVDPIQIHAILSAPLDKVEERYRAWAQRNPQQAAADRAEIERSLRCVGKCK